MATDGTIQSREQFAAKDAKGQRRADARRWALEIQAALDFRKKWIEQAAKVEKKYRDEEESKGEQKLNLFHSNLVTIRALLYGKVPQVDVERRFDDAQDDAARVAAEMLKRHLNQDIERDDDTYREALRYSLEDWSLTDLGAGRVRYVCEMEAVPEVPAQTCPCEACGGSGMMQQVPLAMPMQPMGSPGGSDAAFDAGIESAGVAAPAMDGQSMPGPMEDSESDTCPTCQGTGERELAPAVPEHERKAWEDVETDWIHWRDFLYSPCRVWHERRWVAFRWEMTRDEAIGRFGVIGKRLPLKDRAPGGEDRGDDDDAVKDAWLRAEGWEIWSKEDRKVYWYADGFGTILDVKDDPLGLEGFFPCPRPLLSNATTSKLLPKPDYEYAKHIYEKIDTLYTRVCDLEDAIRASGLYDSTAEGVERLLSEESRNTLIPVKGWLGLVEKGGIEGRISWFPVDVVAKALLATAQQLLAKMELLYQVTGLSDIMRGQAATPATATEQAIKAGFVNTRTQTRQDELARYATDLQKLRAEIISKHFDPETIKERSNIEMTADADKADAAVEVIKSKFMGFRIVVRPESISLPDIAQRKQQGVEFLGALAQFLPAMQPLAAEMPGSMPYMLELLKWAMARFPGAASVEGVLDRAIAEAQKPRPPAPPDPSVMAQQEKAKADVQKAQLGIAATKAKTQATVIGAVADIAKTRAQMAMQPPPMPGAVPVPVPQAQPFQPLVPPPPPMQGGM